MTELVVLIGLQGAGKSTFARARLPEHLLVSKDLWPNGRRKGQRQAREVDAALAAARDVVVDGTNPTRAERAELLAIGRARGARIVGMYFASELEACRARNATRAGRACVPEVALLDTLRRLERPGRDEGWDELLHVRLDGAGGFVVTPWLDGEGG